MTNADGPRAVVEKTVILSLDDVGKLGMYKRVCELLDELDEHDKEAAETKRELAEGRRQMTDSLQKARYAVRTGKEERDVSVTAKPRLHTWEIEYEDASTGEVYEALTRDMLPEERTKYSQTTIDEEIDKATTKKRKAKKKAKADKP